MLKAHVVSDDRLEGKESHLEVEFDRNIGQRAKRGLETDEFEVD